MSSPTFTLPLCVRFYDLDMRDEVPTASILRYLEETAMQASAHAGFDLEWYRKRNQFWVIREMRLERAVAARYLDELEIRTWISSMTRVRSDRNYLVRRVRDGQVVARATANWVYLDSTTMTPTRLGPEILAVFKDFEPPAVAPRPAARWLEPGNRIEAITSRRAQHYEADSARHTNNAIYADWFEESIREALTSNGFLIPLDGSTSLAFCRHAFTYLNGARPGEEVEIRTRLIGLGRTTGEWEQEIQRSKTGEHIARDICTTLWLGQRGQPISWASAGRASRMYMPGS